MPLRTWCATVDESMPSEKRIGATLTGGTLKQTGVLRIADQVTGYFVPAVLTDLQQRSRRCCRRQRARRVDLPDRAMLA